MNETLSLYGRDRGIVGVLTRPSAGAPARSTAALLLNAGMVHHVGPHRLHVRLARRFAAAGFPAVRFDFSSIGDSPVRRDNLPMELSSVEETKEVMDRLEEELGLHRFAVAGICSGGSVAFKVACEDPRIAGAALINARNYDTSREVDQYLTERGLAEYHRETAARDPERWRRLLTGKVSPRRALEVATSVAKGMLPGSSDEGRELLAGEAERILGLVHGFTARGGRMLFVFSEGDQGLQHFRMILGERAGEIGGEGAARRVVVPRIDHTFTLRRRQEELFDLLEEWMAEEVEGGIAPQEAEGDGEREELLL